MKKQKIMENTENFADVMKKYVYKIKRKNGVTLIALIITVIIMLILAGVAISTLNDGLFNKTNRAAQEHKREIIIEAVRTADMYLEIDNIENKKDKKDIVSLMKKLYEISEVKNDGKNYRIEIDEDLQQATIIDLKMKVVVDVIIENNKVIIESEIANNIEEVIPPTIKLSIDPGEETITTLVTITLEAKDEYQGIAKIQLPDNTEKLCSGTKTETITYPVSKNGPYKFVVVGVNGKRATETIEIKNTRKVADIVIKPDNEQPTKDDINITITYDENPAFEGKLLTNEDRYQYRIGENGEWQTADTNSKTMTIAENVEVYARYWNGTEGFGTDSYTINNIDKIEPTVNNVVFTTTNTTNLELEVDAFDKASERAAPSIAGIKDITIEFYTGTNLITTFRSLF